MKRIDDAILIQMPSDSETYGAYWERTLYPDGAVCFRPKKLDNQKLNQKNESKSICARFHLFSSGTGDDMSGHSLRGHLSRLSRRQ